MATAVNNPQTPTPYPAEIPETARPELPEILGTPPPGEFDLFALVLLLRARLWLTLALALLGLIIGALYTWTAKPRYAAGASVLIPQVNAAAAGLAFQQASGLDLFGGGYEVYIDILRSREIADRLIVKHGLLAHYKTNDVPAAEGILGFRTLVLAQREGLLRVIVQDEDPKLAAALANSYLEELDRLNQRLSITAAGQQRRFFEAEMVKEKDLLADAEAALKQNQEKTGVLEPGAQVQANLGAAESTRAQLREKQVELSALLSGETAQNPDVVRLRGEIGSLEGQLHTLEKGGSDTAGALPSSRAPAATLTFAHLAGNVKYHEGLLDLLTHGYQTAKLQEAKDISMVEVLDPATPPELPVWPPKTQFMIFGLLIGAGVGIVLTALEALVRGIARNPMNRARYRALTRGTPLPPTAGLDGLG